MIIVQLVIRHARLSHHMFTKLRSGKSSVFDCGTSPTAVEHFLQDSQNHQNLRAETWPADTFVREKIYSARENLQQTTAYIQAIGVPVSANDEEEEELESYNFF